MDMDFSIELDAKKSKPNKIIFDIKGNQDTGLHKSIINGLRRVLLSSIPTVGFRTDYNNSDILVEKNNTSLHNEFLLDRISLIPLYIDPETYQNQYLFHLNVKNSNDEPITIITANDFQIYPLKKEIDSDSVEKINIDNYDKENPLSDKEKVAIFRPFRFQGNNEFVIITELKSTKSTIHQELEIYGVPSVSYAYEDAKWQAVSCATYSFKKDDSLFKKMLEEKINVNQIPKKEKIRYERELKISESERYFHRDKQAEPYWYTFKIDSVHFLKSKDLFLQANQLLIDQFDLLIKEFPKISSGEDSIMELEEVNQAVYKLFIQGYDDTVGNIIQSYISMNMIDDKSILSVCGYKKVHPLKEQIMFQFSINQENNIFQAQQPQKIAAIISVFQDSCNQLIQIYSQIKDEAIQSL